jgi:hypothetical protein
MTMSKKTAKKNGTWGGRREGAGRKPKGDYLRAPHRARPPHDRDYPTYAILRMLPNLGSLRAPRTFEVVEDALSKSSKNWFRIVHFSVQDDHVHLLVEADGAEDLGRGMQGVMIRVARGVNKVRGQSGHLWRDRWASLALRSPKDVRSALVDLFLNWKKHDPAVKGVDPCSSAPWFDGWETPPRAHRKDRPPVEAPRTSALRTKWKRHGLIKPTEQPALNLEMK